MPLTPDALRRAIPTGISSTTKSDPNAVMLIGSETVPAETASERETSPLNGAGGLTTVLSVTVTAPNGIDSETYEIEVTRLILP